jgi:serine phosphatase RsbU (regulator of sigma subunit)
MELTRRPSPASGPDLARARRWVIASLIAAAVLALLLLANSIQNYVSVSRLLTVRQVREVLSQYVVALEQELRRSPAPGASLPETLAEAAGSGPDRPLWIEVRRPDGSVLARLGSAGAPSFSSEEESAHFRNREALYKVVSVPGGEAVAEVFPLYAAGLAAPSPPPASGTTPSAPRRSLVAVEVAAPLAVRDASVIWPIRRNLVINCSGALALLAAAAAAARGFRAYARGRRLELQMEIARQVQSELLPPATAAWESMRLATVYRPAEEVGGDFYDVFRAPDGRIAIVMGDVSGKGVPAALVMAVIHGAARASAWPESTAAHERESAQLNRLLCEKAAGARYASMFWCYYQPATRQLCYVNAGHCPGLLVGERDHAVSIARLDVGGPVLGLLGDARYDQARCEVRPGDLLVLYSDGLIEAASADGEEYGEGRLRACLAAASAGSPEDVRDAILASAATFVGTASPQDDVTLVVAKFA